MYGIPWAKVRKNLQAVLAAQFQQSKQDTEFIALQAERPVEIYGRVPLTLIVASTVRATYC